jgi:hypothetical protein
MLGNAHDKYRYVEGSFSLEHTNFHHPYKELVEDFSEHYNHNWREVIRKITLWKRFFLNEFPDKPDEVYKIYLDYHKKIDGNDPIKIDNERWEFKGFLYLVKEAYTDEEAKLLILEDYDKERKRFEQLRLKYGGYSTEVAGYSRPRIPENIRIEVWRRDSGKCARCGSRTNLEYDHIVPISKGGSNTARNIELLCEKCNRSKSNNIA